MNLKDCWMFVVLKHLCKYRISNLNFKNYNSFNIPLQQKSGLPLEVLRSLFHVVVLQAQTVLV